MTDAQAAAYVFSMAVQALARIEGMKAANMERERRGEALAYPESAFVEIIEECGIHHNAMITEFNHAIHD